VRSSVSVLGCVVALFASDAMAAPSQLYNKSITITWSEQSTQRSADGQTITPTISTQRIAYVSSAGRVFVRWNRNGPGGEEKGERAPEQSRPGALNFQGNQLVGTYVFHGFARRLVVSFDASFTSCNTSVVYGKAGGPTSWKGLDGVTRELLSINVSGTSCSIREGNALAN
jgi:hypothetical protein